MVSIHLWQNQSCPEFKLSQLPHSRSITTHVRVDPLSKSYLTHIIQTITKSERAEVHILIIDNCDVLKRHPSWLVWSLELLSQIIEVRRFSSLICVDLTLGHYTTVQSFKKCLRRISNKNPCLSLKSLGSRIHTEDVRPGFRLSRAAAKWVERKIVQSICVSIVRLTIV
jgi:hypothetical protein